MKTTTENSTDLELFEAIRKGQYDLIDTLYQDHRAAFVHFAQQQLGANEEDAIDCFQDAVIVFYKNIVGGKLIELTCSIRTYLFAVGKRMIYRKNQQRKREDTTDFKLDQSPINDLDMSVFDKIEDDHRKKVLIDGLNQLGDPCRKILTLFYYHRYPIESIQDALGLSSPGAVRVKKLRCLDKLKGILTKN